MDYKNRLIQDWEARGIVIPKALALVLSLSQLDQWARDEQVAEARRARQIARLDRRGMLLAF